MWEGLRDMAVAEAIYESDASHRPVAVEDVLDGRVDAYQSPSTGTGGWCE